MYPPAAVPRLDPTVYPVAFCDLVHALLACEAGDRPTPAEALESITALTPLGLIGSTHTSTLGRSAITRLADTTLASSSPSTDVLFLSPEPLN